MQTMGIRLIPNEFLIAMPYILTIIATLMRSQFNGPAYLGVPYIKERMQDGMTRFLISLYPILFLIH